MWRGSVKENIFYLWETINKLYTLVKLKNEGGFLLLADVHFFPSAQEFWMRKNLKRYKLATLLIVLASKQSADHKRFFIWLLFIRLHKLPNEQHQKTQANKSFHSDKMIDSDIQKNCFSGFYLICVCPIDYLFAKIQFKPNYFTCPPLVPIQWMFTRTENRHTETVHLTVGRMSKSAR